MIPQAKEALRERDGQNGLAYCCLGVLTDLYVKDGHSEEFLTEGWKDSVWEHGGVLAPPVCDWAGLDESNPSLTPDLSATDVNDRGSPSAEIADLIDGGVS